MKKRLYTLITLFSLILLSSCATTTGASVSSDSNTVENPDIYENSSPTIDQANSNIKLSLNKEHTKITAKLYTDWNKKPQGTLFVNFMPPKESPCPDNSYPMTKYKEINDYSKAIIKLIPAPNTNCYGQWTISVIDKTDNAIIASKTINAQPIHI